MSWDGYNTAITANRFQKAFVLDYVDLSGRLLVRNGDVSLNNRLFVIDDASFMSNVYVNNDLIVNDRLFVIDDASFMSNVYVNNKLTLNAGFNSLTDISVNTLNIGRGGGGVATNTAIGYQAGYSNSTGTNNIALGYQSGFTNTTGLSNVSIGSLAGYSNTSSNNFSLGYRAGYSTTTGGNNIYIGTDSGYTGTTAETNVAIGTQSLYNNNQSKIVAIGYKALYNNTTGGDNVAIGFEAMMNNISNNSCTALGYHALYYSTANYNTAIGPHSLEQCTTGDSNTAIGMGAGGATTTGSFNTYVGRDAGTDTSGGSYNTYVGGYAGTTNSTGSFNTYIGYQTTTNAVGHNWSTAIGFGATITGNNQIVLGRLNEKVYIPGTIGIRTTAPAGLLDISGSAITTSISSSGYLGIATTTPAGLLDISGSAVRTTIIANGNIGIRTTTPAGLLDITGTAVRTTIIANGNVGIGTTTPSVPLHVVTTGTIAAGSSRFFTSTASQLSASAAGGTPAAGIYSTGSIISTVGFYASSDIRIKKNIMDATDLSCSYILQYLKPKIFNFIDTKQNNIEPTWGFIAQEVKEIMPNAISYIKEYITNIYESADLSGNMITLRNKTTADLLKDETGYNKLKIFNTDEKEKIVTIKEIIDEKRFIIESEEPIETENNIVFIYGQEVPDFHSLDKDMIFTLTTAVVKEIDNDLRITKERVKILEEENATLKQELKDVIKRLENAGI